VAAQMVSAVIERFEDIARRAAASNENYAESGINIVWWIAFVVSLIMWAGLIAAVIWGVRLMLA